jgi:hypothetical protein
VHSFSVGATVLVLEGRGCGSCCRHDSLLQQPCAAAKCCCCVCGPVVRRGQSLYSSRCLHVKDRRSDIQM